MQTPRATTAVMIAGIGGASLGTELAKSLQLAGGYEIHGCDVSPTAYGLYDSMFASTRRVDRDNYPATVIAACRSAGAIWLIPGGEQPMTLLSAAAGALESAGIRLVANDPAVVALCSDKAASFERLAAAGLPVPRTRAIVRDTDPGEIGFPCIVKPATGSGGSSLVFLAADAGEAMIYAGLIQRSGNVAIAQQYVGIDDGEFTIGVLSLPNGEVAGSIAMRRALDAKLSVAYRSRLGVISSGYSQGHIGAYPELCRQAEQIALAVGSRGPLNVQGRVAGGFLLPFEINPRFSASTYLRALAGFNEVDAYLRHLRDGTTVPAPDIRPGWYLRSLIETVVADGGLQ